MTAALLFSASPQMNLFSQLFQPQTSPADNYAPDGSRGPSLPKSYGEIHTAACAGVLAALGKEPAVEVDFPPIANVNARGDGSAKSEALVNRANAEFIAKLVASLQGRSVAVVGCSGGAVSALGGNAVPFRDAAAAAAGKDVAIVVAPAAEEQWEAAASGLGAGTVVVVNGLLSTGLLPHAYYYKPMTAFSAQTGGVVRGYPSAYEVFDLKGRRLEGLEIGLTVQGRRALPDTKEAQLRLQNAYGANM